MIRKADYTVVKVEPRVVWIVDNDAPGTPSVTNTAEDVVQHLLRLYGPERRIFYRDTMNRWDELQHDGKAFRGFKPGTSGLTPPL